MTDVLIEALRPAAARCLAGARMPGLVLAVARGEGPVQTLALGTDAADAPLNAQSLFIVASVTKLSLALALLRLVDTGDLGLDDELALTVPDAVAAASGVTIRRLLSHTAGLPPDVAQADAPYAVGLDWPTLAQACCRTPLRDVPGSVVQYGNVGYGLLALVIERVSGLAYAAALADLVLRPLGIEGYLGVEPERGVTRQADVRARGADPALEPYNSVFYRSLAMPWAGLVTTAGGALALVRAFAGRPAGLISPWLLAEATATQTGDLGGGAGGPLWWPRCPWGLGPEIKGEKQPHWSPAAAPASFGHAGQSGCLVWHDPASDTSYALLGARTADSGWLLRHGAALGDAVITPANVAD